MRAPWIVASALLLPLLAVTCLDPARAEEPAPASAYAVERLATGYRFTEGPAWNGAGQLLFSDIPNEHIHRFDAKTGKAVRHMEKSGRSNGLAFDAKGRLLACEGGRRRLVRHGKSGVEVLASHYDGKRLNSPNDLAIDAMGGIYFTDPRYGKQDDRELDFEGVYYRSPKGALTRVCPEMVKPNGILLAADGKTLYVAASRQKRIMAYTVKSPGKPSNPREFAPLDKEARGGPDGMTKDDHGHVMVGGQGHLWVWDASGKQVAKVKIPESPTNCCFVPGETWTVYVTARTSLYRVTRKAK